METQKPARQRETEDRRHEGIVSPVEGFNERGGKAAQDKELHDSVELFTGKAVAARNAVLHALPEAPELRERAYRIKQETMANLDRYLEQMADAVEERGGKVFLDPTRAGGATVVAAYSPRARAGVPVSFPVAWDDLAGASPAEFTIATVPRLLGDADPWTTLMPPPQVLDRGLVEEGHRIPVARVAAMHEGKRRARARRAAQ